MMMAQIELVIIIKANWHLNLIVPIILVNYDHFEAQLMILISQVKVLMNIKQKI
jgi:hypothetical protein